MVTLITMLLALRKGVDNMVTYSELFQLGILIVSIINLIYTIRKK